MDVLCTDKTGTLTMDKIVLKLHCNIVGQEDAEVLKYAYINSYCQTGLRNLLDRAILERELPAGAEFVKVDEIPFDFGRKIMSVVAEAGGQRLLIAKGAPEEIYRRCDRYQLQGEIYEMDNLVFPDLKEQFDALSSEGFRVLGVAYKEVDRQRSAYSRDDEAGLILMGYVAFLDPPKPTARQALEALAGLGIDCKVLTGDNELVTRKICGEVGLDIKGLATGDQVGRLSDQELQELVKQTTVFARLSPLQKERVIHALHANGRTVGYLGDGINDALALKAADVGISVNNAADIARESADIILLKKSLMVLEDGVIEGRRTFGNIIKYIRMGGSSNFGNMVSMTGASLVLPFLPMAPVQILLNNFLYDLSQVAIATDHVDRQYLASPRPWDVKAIRNFMLIFGPVSSLFDFVTFGVLWFLGVRANQQNLFHTVWFMESLVSQALVIQIIRTSRRPLQESRPSRLLVVSSVAVAAAALVIPCLPLAHKLGFVCPPPMYFGIVIAIVAAYLLSVELTKRWYVRRYGV
jgi:Mg2+-importing ATPase